MLNTSFQLFDSKEHFSVCCPLHSQTSSDPQTVPAAFTGGSKEKEKTLGIAMFQKCLKTAIQTVLLVQFLGITNTVIEGVEEG